MFEFNFFFLVFFSSSPLLISQFSASHLYFRWFYFFFSPGLGATHTEHTKTNFGQTLSIFFFPNIIFVFRFALWPPKSCFINFASKIEREQVQRAKFRQNPVCGTLNRLIYLFEIMCFLFVSGSRNWRNSCSVTRGNCERIIRIPTMKTTATCRSSSNSSSSDRSNRRTVAQQVSQPLS